MSKKTGWKTYVILHLLFAVASVSAMCGKFASGYEFLSLKYCLFMCGMIGCLGIYALGWQQIIKHMPLAKAYVNKAATVVWGMIWSLLIFKEHLTVGKIVGAAVVIAGVVLFALSDPEPEDSGSETSGSGKDGAL